MPDIERRRKSPPLSTLQMLEREFAAWPPPAELTVDAVLDLLQRAGAAPRGPEHVGLLRSVIGYLSAKRAGRGPAHAAVSPEAYPASVHPRRADPGGIVMLFGSYEVTVGEQHEISPNGPAVRFVDLAVEAIGWEPKSRERIARILREHRKAAEHEAGYWQLRVRIARRARARARLPLPSWQRPEIAIIPNYLRP